MKVRYRGSPWRIWNRFLLSRRAQSGRGAQVLDAIRAAIDNMKIVGRYHYKIFYSVGADAIEILHVRHGARRPWLSEG
jgi:plasmid stabilization system protein ParE